ncbi:PoNe immunity protein domain-containing protein [Butyrivibrio proteoclasticus]|uniref:PoNe immunity protein domain-containing protein n=1 Tax=Butyrivibrio proteoclasticus TaxID=43305 RepID=UPI0004797A15|nr:PoNe immunity protein domain-containing protein [Butyrivibrio proteoclasticus]
MRDDRCDKKRLEIILKYNPEFIEESKAKIRDLINDEDNGIQRYPRQNSDIIYSTKLSIVKDIRELMHAQYSYGMNMEEFDGLYDEMMNYILDTNVEEIGYINLLYLISYGVLLQKERDSLIKLAKKMDDEEINDILLDALLNLYGVKRSFQSDGYAKENPYKYMVEIIDSAYDKKEDTSTLLSSYINNKWLRGHSDLGWPKNISQKGYRGIWAYEAAAVAKLFDIDDSKLRESPHYPYDLAHFKPTTIKVCEQERLFIKKKDVSYEAQEELIIDAKSIIPPCFYKYVNEIASDYTKLSDKDFWTKYELDQVWFELEDYIVEKKQNDILGMLIVFELVDKGYILQLDWKEDFGDFREHMKNYWKEDGDMKVITFDLDNDQQYYALIPNENKVCDLFGIEVKDFPDTPEI